MTNFNHVQYWSIDALDDGQRIDNFLFKKLKKVPKSRLYRLIRKGEFRINKKRIKAEYKLNQGDCLRIPPIRLPETSPPVTLKQIKKSSTTEWLMDHIILETSHYLVLNKPSGMAVHGGSGLSFGVIEALRLLKPNEHYLELVHRLDKDTSGCLLIAKKRSFLVYFQNQLRHRKMHKEYIALVWGRWLNQKKVVSEPLLKKSLPNGGHHVIISEEGKPSKTVFSLIKSYPDTTLIKAVPLTGRTHQIRVHAKSCGHALVGDQKYVQKHLNKTLLERYHSHTFFLHAHKLSFYLPIIDPDSGNIQNNQKGEYITVEAPLSERMKSRI
jgi:23S rRNA pseudouridine955/2504/2580 synthase